MKQRILTILNYLNREVSSKVKRVMQSFRIREFLKTFNLRHELENQINEIPEISQFFPREKMQQHYVYESTRDTNENPDVYLHQLRYYWYYSFFRRKFPDLFDTNTTVLDVGDTSGNLIEALNKKGTILNINKECIDWVEKKGIRGILGNAENIDLPEKSFDYVMCFQMLEHVPNPLKVLNELARIAKKRVFLSIPLVEQTIIYNKDFWLKELRDSWKETDPRNVDCHIFEFSTQDLKNLLSFTSLEYVMNTPIFYFKNNTPKRIFYNQYFKSYFNFFVLKPTESR